MLKELAFTPHIFDEETNSGDPQWSNHLRKLGGNIFHHNAACPFLISDLLNGSWKAVAAGMVDAIRDHKARGLAQSLLSQMDNVLVPRTSTRNWAEEETDWASDAMRLNQDGLEADRVVASNPVAEPLKAAGDSIWALSETEDKRFWHNMESDDSPPMVLAEQIHRLRRICLHAGFIAIVSPCMKGTDTDETEFALEIIRSACARPSGYGKLAIDVHAEGPELHRGQSAYSDTLTRIKDMLLQKLRPLRDPNVTIRLFIWEKLRERILLAGRLRYDSAGDPLPNARWGIGMQHMARPGEVDMSDATIWTLLKPRAVGSWYREFYAPTKPPLLGPLNV